MTILANHFIIVILITTMINATKDIQCISVLFSASACKCVHLPVGRDSTQPPGIKEPSLGRWRASWKCCLALFLTLRTWQ